MTDSELRELQRVTLDEVERGQILLVLANAYPRRLTPKVLRYLLKERCYDLDSDKLDFHIEYLREKGGWVSIEGGRGEWAGAHGEDNSCGHRPD